MDNMKHKDFKPCGMCGLGVMHTGMPLFYRIKIQRYGVQMPAVHRAAGLEQMLGGNATLANIMGVDADLATPITDEIEILVCEECASKTTMVHALAEEGAAVEVPG